MNNNAQLDYSIGDQQASVPLHIDGDGVATLLDAPYLAHDVFGDKAADAFRCFIERLGADSAGSFVYLGERCTWNTHRNPTLL